MSVRFEIPGKPFAKQRPRVGKWGGYTPKETVSFERTVGQIALEHIKTPLEGPICVDIVAIFEPAKSWSKKKKEDHMWQAHTQRPDLDNLAKAILDGMNRIAFADDGQVSRMKCKKQWGENAKTIVTITADRGAL